MLTIESCSYDKTFVFMYNDNGNIIGFDTVAYTTENVSNDTVTETHVYDSTIKDRLVKFNNISISYDANGCPTYYNGRNYTWTKGKLTRVYCGAAQQPGSLYADCKFTYDAYGRRLSKSYTYDPNPASTSDYSYTYNTTYTYDNSGRLVREYCIEKYISGTTNTRDITYLYDESNIIGAVQTYNGTTETFYFDRNIKGDVIALYNSAGTKVANYIYDAWGNCTTKTIVVNNFSAYNPIRYKGYYYDRETRLYYFNARYYNPEWRRFISPAQIEALNPSNVNGFNLYSYMNSNPISIVYSSSNVGGNVINPSFNYGVSSLIIPNLETHVNNSGFNIHWKNDWFATDWPSFFVFSKTKGALLDWGLSIYKGSLYFDEAENHSIYIGVGNVSAFVGYNVEKDKYGVFADANVLSVGYDGEYIDAGISVVGVGFILGWEDKKFRFKIDPPGWFGFDISIDFGQIIKDIFGWEW